MPQKSCPISVPPHDPASTKRIGHDIIITIYLHKPLTYAEKDIWNNFIPNRKPTIKLPFVYITQYKYIAYKICNKD